MQVLEFNACVAESMTKQEFSKELRERKKIQNLLLRKKNIYYYD